MASYNFQKKSTARKKATSLRKKGLKTSVFKKKKGWGVSSTR